ncbi:hypothetical protein M5689_008272 [Euphorbia peplus]|nr:hypothetical protein M5689_008272 [Euphorbia peplus]
MIILSCFNQAFVFYDVDIARETSTVTGFTINGGKSKADTKSSKLSVNMKRGRGKMKVEPVKETGKAPFVVKVEEMKVKYEKRENESQKSEPVKETWKAPFVVKVEEMKVKYEKRENESQKSEPVKETWKAPFVVKVEKVKVEYVKKEHESQKSECEVNNDEELVEIINLE